MVNSIANGRRRHAPPTGGTPSPEKNSEDKNPEDKSLADKDPGDGLLSSFG
jgi:hypothetical protein